MDYVPFVLVNVFGFAIGLTLGTFAHESGHAGVGALLRCGPRLMSIGRGPIVLRQRFGRFWLVVRALPFGGYVASLPRGADQRAAHVAVVAAGPAMNLILFAPFAAAFFRPIDLDYVYRDSFIIGFAGAQLAFAFAALFPHRFKVGRDRRVFLSDGLKLYLFARGRYPDELDVLRRTYLQHPSDRRAPLPPRTAVTPELLYQLSRRDGALERWARADSISVLRKIEIAGTLNEAERQIVRTRLAIADAHPELF